MLLESPKQVAKRIGKDRRWIVALCNENKLPHIKVNGRYQIDVDKLEEAFAAMEADSNSAARNFVPQEYASVHSQYRLE
ncbi:MAG: helix-turn-helix domain-containing protein [Acholeplasmataceae bacterium]|nr:helix-turn-helix domain-containing protein [Acholeplasmataceae bacterium]